MTDLTPSFKYLKARWLTITNTDAIKRTTETLGTLETEHQFIGRGRN